MSADDLDGDDMLDGLDDEDLDNLGDEMDDDELDDDLEFVDGAEDVLAAMEVAVLGGGWRNDL